jgi:hypothetical protein
MNINNKMHWGTGEASNVILCGAAATALGSKCGEPWRRRIYGESLIKQSGALKNNKN